jgi:glycosyltransferase involved in cell wall biosynthesis
VPDNAASIVVIIPCHNEEATVAKVIADVRVHLPSAAVVVFDNASSDSTRQRALAAGATVRSESRLGKGNVVRRAFADLEADIYVLIDGDDTYEAAALPRMFERLLTEHLDFVNGVRHYEAASRERRGHVLGNRLLTGGVSLLFGRNVPDMLSGCKVLSRRFVRSFPSMSTGFEIETELAVHALQLRVPAGEEPVSYRARPEDSVSKLHTFRDGWRILRTIIRLAARERPLLVFGGAALLLGVVSLALGVPVVIEFHATGLVDRFPTAILAAAVATIAVLSLVSGLILDAIQHGRHEAKRLTYLRISW